MSANQSRHSSDIPFIAIRTEADLAKLPNWLRNRSYTYFGDDMPDSKGNKMIRLYYDKYPDKDHAWGVEKRGNICVPNLELVEQVRALVDKAKRKAAA